MAGYIPEGQGSPSSDEGGRGGCAGCAMGVACPGAAVSVWGPVSARAAETPAARWARRGCPDPAPAPRGAGSAGGPGRLFVFVDETPRSLPLAEEGQGAGGTPLASAAASERPSPLGFSWHL